MNEITLHRAGSWRPSQFDHPIGGFLSDDQRDWLIVPVVRSRDSNTLDQCNFDVALESLREADPDGEDHQLHRFGHWACGWYEVILVRPGTECERVAQEIADQLEDYPILDEFRLSEYEADAIADLWANMSLRDRLEYAHKAGASPFSIRGQAVPEWFYDEAHAQGLLY